MTALDQAFIKAYLRQGGKPATDELESAQPVRLDAALQDDLPESQNPESNPTTDKLLSSPSTQRAAVPLKALEFSGTGLFSAIGNNIGNTGFFGHTESDDKAQPDDKPAEPAATSPSTEHAETNTPGGHFEPLLRIDSVSWPRPSRRLLTAASEQIRRLAKAICEAAESEHKLIGIAGFSHGEGCTTVLLAVALRLVELGRKILVVDGDVAKPRLPGQLGLINDHGWRDVALGLLALEDVVTQSDSESLSLLPYCGTETPMDGPEPLLQTMAAFLDRIRSHYDVILVDLGGSLTSGGTEGALAEKLTGQIDSVLTVQNIRTTSPAQLAMLRQHFRRLGVPETGIIENFVGE